jgi:hypothetical protein
MRPSSFAVMAPIKAVIISTKKNHFCHGLCIIPLSYHQLYLILNGQVIACAIYYLPGIALAIFLIPCDWRKKSMQKGYCNSAISGENHIL